MKLHPILIILITICIFPIILSACGGSTPTVVNVPTAERTGAVVSASPAPSETPIPPTPTPVPLAAVINGEAITLAEFKSELARYQASVPITGTNPAPDPNTVVMNELIDQTLLAQGAAELGYIVDAARLQEKIDSLVVQLGGLQALEAWKASNGYGDDDFEQALKRSMGSAWMRDQIINSVPETADQVHVMQILLPQANEADEAYALLQSGSDFSELAALYDPLTRGELGWFPRHYLDEPAIEQAAFDLQPGQYSPVIETEIGYHILYLVERDENHVLLPDARIALQVKALMDWLAEKRGQSEIEILVP